MHRNATVILRVCILLSMMFPVTSAAQQRREKQPLEHPEFWVTPQGDRMRQDLPYLAEADPRTVVRAPLKSRVWQKKFIVYDDFRGEFLRLERKKDYVRISVRTTDDMRHTGYIRLGGPQKLFLKNLVLFFGQKMTHGKYSLYEQIRAFNDPDVEKYPVVVLRLTGPESGVIYLDPMASGTPLAIVNLASAPPRK